MRGMHNEKPRSKTRFEKPPGRMPEQAHSGHSVYSAKIVPQIKITNIKARYLGFSVIFDVIWVDFLAIRSIITPKAF